MSTILILSGIAWNDAYQRHQFVAESLVKGGHTVYFLESIPSSRFSFAKLLERMRSIKIKVNKRSSSTNKALEGIRVLKYAYLNPEFVFFNKLVLSCGDLPQIDIIYTFLPIDLTLQIKKIYPHSKLIYDCVRNFKDWGGYSIKTIKNELELLKISDKVLVDSYFLKNKWITYNPLQLLPTVEKSLYDKFKSFDVKNGEIKNIAFFGSLGKHCELSIIENLISDGYNFHLFGLNNLDKKLNEKEGFINHGFYNDIELMLTDIYCNSDALIIPYKNDLNGVIPAKLMQSLLLPLPTFVSEFYDSRKLDQYLCVYTSYSNLLHNIKNYNFDNLINNRATTLSFVKDNTDIKCKNRILKIITDLK